MAVNSVPEAEMNEDMGVGDHYAGAQEPPLVDASRRGRGRTRPEIIQQQEQQDYGGGSDGSETLSVNSAQSMQNRASARAQREADQIRHHQQQQQRNYARARDEEYRDSRDDETDRGGRQQLQMEHMMQGEEMDMMEGAMDEEMPQSYYNPASQQAMSARTPTIIAASMKDSNRKKSLMTRLIPGRAGTSDVKRMGFARSEEVGLDALQVPGAMNNSQDGEVGGVGLVQHPSFIKQASKESTDSSDK